MVQAVDNPEQCCWVKNNGKEDLAIERVTGEHDDLLFPIDIRIHCLQGIFKAFSQRLEDWPKVVPCSVQHSAFQLGSRFLTARSQINWVANLDLNRLNNW